jgi:hypothetical protein
VRAISYATVAGNFMKLAFDTAEAAQACRERWGDFLYRPGDVARRLSRDPARRP